MFPEPVCSDFQIGIYCEIVILNLCNSVIPKKKPNKQKTFQCVCWTGMKGGSRWDNILYLFLTRVLEKPTSPLLPKTRTAMRAALCAWKYWSFTWDLPRSTSLTTLAILYRLYTHSHQVYILSKQHNLNKKDSVCDFCHYQYIVFIFTAVLEPFHRCGARVRVWAVESRLLYRGPFFKSGSDHPLGP